MSNTVYSLQLKPVTCIHKRGHDLTRMVEVDIVL